MWVLLIGLVVCIPVGIILNHQHSLWLQALGGTIVGWWMLGFVLWVVLVHTRRRWPHLSRQVRWGMLIPGAPTEEEDAVAEFNRSLEQS